MKLDAKTIMKGIDIRIQMPTERELWGIFGWRIWLSTRLFRLGARVLRCGGVVIDRMPIPKPVILFCNLCGQKRQVRWELPEGWMCNECHEGKMAYLELRHHRGEA